MANVGTQVTRHHRSTLKSVFFLDFEHSLVFLFHFEYRIVKKNVIRAVFTLFGQHIMCSNPDFLFLVALAFILVDQFFLAAILDIYSSMMAKVETPGYMVVVST